MITALEKIIFTGVVLFLTSAYAATPSSQPIALFMLPESATQLPPHHTRHAEIFSASAPGNNHAVLQAIDRVQSSAMDGGGYFIGVKANPLESPIGYPLKLYGRSLLSPPRKSSYCSGASYTVFIEALNILVPDGQEKLSSDRAESLRMQEPDGSRREDGVKFWGHWNDDGPGTQYALVQYAKMGESIRPADARPGDFVNISWKSGLGHSAIFLGFLRDSKGSMRMLYWSSQTGTNGLGDQSSALEKIKEVHFVRLTHPEKLFTFDPQTAVNRKVPGDTIQP